MDKLLNSDWKEILKDEFEKSYFIKLKNFINDEYATKTIFPPRKELFNAFNKCSFDNLKVVILGQDPYPTPGNANGLSFSVNDGIKIPKSLVNIFKEMESDVNKEYPISGNLEYLSSQGVLLLNTVLTVVANDANSHRKKGWEEFTDSVIKKISENKENVVFILWGSPAKSKINLIDQSKHYIITSVHPSPLSSYRGFFGSKPFSKTNYYLKIVGKGIIHW